MEQCSNGHYQWQPEQKQSTLKPKYCKSYKQICGYVWFDWLPPRLADTTVESEIYKPCLWSSYASNLFTHGKPRLWLKSLVNQTKHCMKNYNLNEMIYNVNKQSWKTVNQIYTNICIRYLVYYSASIDAVYRGVVKIIACDIYSLRSKDISNRYLSFIEYGWQRQNKHKPNWIF